jgi:hypothetical protein
MVVARQFIAGKDVLLRIYLDAVSDVNGKPGLLISEEVNRTIM